MCGGGQDCVGTKYSASHGVFALCPPATARRAQTPPPTLLPRYLPAVDRSQIQSQIAAIPIRQHRNLRRIWAVIACWFILRLGRESKRLGAEVRRLGRELKGDRT